MSSDQCTLDHAVGIGAHDRPVLERPRLALGAIDDDGGRVRAGGVLGDGPPLPSGREAGAAPAAETGVFDELDQDRRVDLLGAVESGAAARREVSGQVSNGRFVEDALDGEGRRHALCIPMAQGSQSIFGSGGKAGGRLSTKLETPSLKSGRLNDSAISWLASRIDSRRSRSQSFHTWRFITAIDAGEQFSTMSRAYATVSASNWSGSYHAVDKAHREGLLGEHHARREENVERTRRAHHAGQGPRQTVLGDETAAGERSCELGALGREAHVAEQRLGHADSGARTVDGSDDRLADGQGMGLRHALPVLTFDIATVDALQHVHVGAGTPAATRARDNDRSHVGVGIALGEQVEVLELHRCRPGVEPIGPVQREGGDTIGDVTEHEIVGRHAVTLPSLAMAKPWPLEGVRVLDMSRVMSGPFAGRLLADLGADVVKLEPPDGDLLRRFGEVRRGRSGFYNQQNAGKRNVCVDLRADGATAVVADLAAVADVLIENFRPGTMERYGLGYETLSARNPRLVMLSVTGFGQDGPSASRQTYAPVIHAEAGLIHRQASYDGPYTDPIMSIADSTTALHGLSAVLAALLLRARTGEGQYIDLSMLDAMLATDDYNHHGVDQSPIKRLGGEVWERSAAR